MNRRLFVLGMVLAFLPALALAQEAKKDATHLKIKRYIADLSHPDFQVREKATRELMRIGRPAEPELKKALQSDNPEVKARARRILAALAKASPQEPGRSDPGEGDGRNPRLMEKTLRKLMQDLLRQRGFFGRKDEKDAEEDDKADGSRDPFEDLFRGLSEFFERKGWPAPWEEDRDDFFRKWKEHRERLVPRNLEELRKEMEKRQEELRRRMERMRKGRAPQSFRQSLTVLPDRTVLRYTRGEEDVEVVRRKDGAVRIRVTDAGGESRTFEAPSEEALRKEHPEAVPYLRSSFPGGVFRFRWNGRPFGEPGKPPRPRPARPAAPDPAFGMRTGPVSPILQRHLGLEPGRGFLVTAVDPEGPARSWGLEPYDIVLAAAGRPVSSEQDLAKALEGVEPGAEVEMDIMRRARRVVLTFRR